MATLSASGKRWAIVAAILALIVVVAAFNFQSIAVALAVATAEKRPTLLNDAQWDKPLSARKFHEQFAPGTSERELLAWLETNRFRVDRTNKSADRSDKGVPCNERVNVTQQTSAKGQLSDARAEVA